MAAYVRHALHVQLNEVSLVVLQDGQAHTEDNLEALQTHRIFYYMRFVRSVDRIYTKCISRHINDMLKMFPTSYMKISKMRVATGRGRNVRKRVRNQDEAYIDVWKLWDRKWTFSSGSCSCGNKRAPFLTSNNPGKLKKPCQKEEVMYWRYK